MAIIVSSTFFCEDFDFQKDSKTLVQEISMLSHGRRTPVFTTIYDDACDIGLKVISKKTGKEVVFYVGEPDMNDDEIAGWRLFPTTESIRKVPEAADLKMLIIND